VPKNQGADALFLQPAISLFDSDQEHQYYGLFANKIAIEISPYFNPESWSRLLLQACVTETSIRHAAIAIGALGKAYDVAQAVCGPADGPKLLSDVNRSPSFGKRMGFITAEEMANEALVTEAYSHHRRALEQYDKAIKRMRRDISNGNQSRRTTLIMCIVLICFEAIHGNHESAAGQLQSGLALIQDWKSAQCNAEKHPQGFSSPAPDIIEDFLVQTFGRMEIQSMSVFDPRSVDVHLELKHEGKETIEKMPQQFYTVEEARIFLDLITRRLMHFNCSIHPRGKPPSPASSRESTPTKPGPWVDGMPAEPMPFIDGKIPIEQTQSIRSSRELLSEQGALNNELGAWREAFRPLLTYARSTGGQEAISALTMTISAVSSSISLRAAFFINESAYDIFLPEFRIIVDYSRILLGLQQSQSGLAMMKDGDPLTDDSGTGPTINFAFDFGVVPALYLVMVKCRDPKLRRAAMRLLEENPRREGVWDSVATTALGRWVISLEEEGARRLSMSSASTSPTTTADYESEPDDHILKRRLSTQSQPRSWGSIPRQSAFAPIDSMIPIPEEMRVRKAQMRFNLLERRANMSCLHLDLEKGIPVQKTAIFTW
jgi:hypothetical protein